MEKQDVYEFLKKIEKNAILNVRWNRGNGMLEKFMRFEGFDEKNNPQLYTGNFDKPVRFDIDAIGGYSSIISLQEEYPDGDCVN